MKIVALWSLLEALEMSNFVENVGPKQAEFFDENAGPRKAIFAMKLMLLTRCSATRKWGTVDGMRCSVTRK